MGIFSTTISSSASMHETVYLTLYLWNVRDFEKICRTMNNLNFAKRQIITDKNRGIFRKSLNGIGIDLQSDQKEIVTLCKRDSREFHSLKIEKKRFPFR